MRFGRLVERLVAGQRDLGPLLRFESIVPFSLVVWVAAGSFLTLPPGPLCDEGMVLFMEGGCDWGESNLFFFAKVSLLLTINLALIAAWFRPPVSWRGLWPHFVLLGLVGWLYRSGGSCDTYYAHPNGSPGQMVFEMACFAALGVALARVTLDWRWPPRLAVLAGWNGLQVGLFYLYLEVAPHWTWIHTAALGATLLTAAAVVWTVVPAAAAHPCRARGPGVERSRGPALSAFFIAATFGLIWNPLGLAPVVFLCLGVGLATAWMVRRVAGTAATRSVALLFALAIPACGVVRSWIDYTEQERYASSLLETVGNLTLQDTAALEAAAASSRLADGGYERADLSGDAAVRRIGERVSEQALLRSGSTLTVFVPLDQESYARIAWWCYAKCDGSFGADVIERLVTEHGSLEGHEAVRHYQAGGRSPWPSRARYVLDTALRWKPPRFYSAATTVDDGGVRAMVVLATTP